MKQLLLTRLRDKTTSRAEFRQSADDLALLLAQESAEYVPTKKIELQTPMASCTGTDLASSRIMLVPILRSGLVLLPSFLRVYPEAIVGVVGLKRDEETAIAQLYYKNIPKVTPEDFIIVLDPMLATGGSACDALAMLTAMGVRQEKMLFAGIISSQEGVDRVAKEFPSVKLLIAGCDKQMSPAKFIIPGLGDFGDRYFGTEDGTVATIKKLKA